MHSYSLYAKWADNYLDGKVAGFTNTLIAKMSSAKVMHTEFGLCTTHERSFGLFRSNGQLKPYKDIIKEYQNLKVRQIPNPQKIDNQIYYNKPMEYLSKENFLYNSSNL